MLCSVSMCPMKSRAREMCLAHYHRWRRHGDVDFALRDHGIGTTPAERFWSRVTKSDDETGCWIWTGATSGKGQGYGTVRLHSKPTKAHRAAWFYTYGSMPLLHLLHSCDNPLCVNPSHLREGTPLENVADMISRGRAHWQRRLR